MFTKRWCNLVIVEEWQCKRTATRHCESPAFNMPRARCPIFAGSRGIAPVRTGITGEHGNGPEPVLNEIQLTSNLSLNLHEPNMIAMVIFTKVTGA